LYEKIVKHLIIYIKVKTLNMGKSLHIAHNLYDCACKIITIKYKHTINL